MFRQCLYLTVISTIFSALGMSFPYVGGMIAGQGMDSRALNTGNLVYPYHGSMMSFPNFSAAYGQGHRVKNSEEATTLDKTTNSSSQLRLAKWETWLLMLYSWSRTLSFYGDRPRRTSGLNAGERVIIAR